MLPEDLTPEISDLVEPVLESAETEETVFDLPIPPEEPPAEPQEEPLDQEYRDEGHDFEAMMNKAVAASGWGYLVAIVIGLGILLLWRKPRFLGYIFRRKQKE